MKNIDLEDDSFWNSLHLTDKLQKNLDILYKKLGTKFMITYKKKGTKESCTMPVFFYKKKSKNGELNYYVIKYGKKSRPGNKLYPFSIFMYYNPNQIKIEDINDVYIQNISAIEKDDYEGQKPISGSTIVEMIILFMKDLKVKNIYLHDGASITCETNENTMLSPFKLLEKKRTFYMKFGFKPVLPEFLYNLGQYKNTDSFIKMTNKSITKIKKIDMKDLHQYIKECIQLINRIYINNDFENVDLFNQYIPNNYSEKKMDKSSNKKLLENYREECIKLQKEMPKNGNLLKWIKQIFYKSCKVYKTLLKVVHPMIHAIYYDKKLYKMKYRDDFENLFIYNELNYKLELSE